jgi:predicted ATP-grasp superfamily ATP-dependent carboligase
MDGQSVLLVGASVRAAAYSAVRAGLRPWAIDLFADRDLAAIGPARQVPPGGYPAACVDMASEAPPGPWMYTGALENRPAVVEQIARDRPLWGNDAACLRRVRDPFALADALRAAGLPCPAVRRSTIAGVCDPDPESPGPQTPATKDQSVAGRWLMKPLASAGGAGIRFIPAKSTGRLRDPARHYLQEFVSGESRSGVFLADTDGCRLLGVTRQLVGESWLHAPAFRYSGGVGPLALSAPEQAAWQRLGEAVTAFAGLRGLFGIDAVIRDGMPWAVEVNPRYTASIEVIEYATGVRALELQRAVFDEGFLPSREGQGRKTQSPSLTPPARKDAVVGKAVWYAPRALAVPAEGPWDRMLRGAIAVGTPPPFADIPPAGERIAAQRPVMTAFAVGESVADCERRLRAAAADLDARLLR